MINKTFVFFILFVTTACASKKVIIAHRGASAYLPEHTLEAYSYAHALRVDFIEPDLVLTKDNIPICVHDIHLESTTNVEEIFPKRKRSDGRWYAVDFTLKEIKKLSVHEREKKNKKRVFSKRFPQRISNFKVPTFVEFIELVQGLNESTSQTIGIYPEIKAPEFHQNNKKDITKVVYSIIKKYGYENKNDEIFIQSFFPKTLKRLKAEFKTRIPLIQLIADDSWGESTTNYSKMMTSKGLKEISNYADGVGIWLTHLENKSLFLKDIKKTNLLVHGYTHRPETQTKKRLSLFRKLDGIFSDAPDTLEAK